MLRAVASGALLPEAVLWSLLVQLTAALRAVHTAGLACRYLLLVLVYQTCNSCLYFQLRIIFFSTQYLSAMLFLIVEDFRNMSCRQRGHDVRPISSYRLYFLDTTSYIDFVFAKITYNRSSVTKEAYILKIEVRTLLSLTKNQVVGRQSKNPALGGKVRASSQ